MPIANSGDRRTDDDDDQPKRRRLGRRGGRRIQTRDDEPVSAADRRAADGDDDELTDSIVAAVTGTTAPSDVDAGQARAEAESPESADEAPRNDRDNDIEGVVVEARTSHRERDVEPGRRRHRRDGGRGRGRDQDDRPSPTPGPAAASEPDDDNDDRIESREVDMSRADQVEEQDWEGDDDDVEIVVTPSDRQAERPASPADTATDEGPDDEAPTARAVTVETAQDLRIGAQRGVQEMLINVADPDECRIALVTDGRLDELYMERKASASHVGNIYKGRVTNVEPSIQAAFIDFGLPVNGFLHISDLHPQYFPGEQDSERVGHKTPRRDRPPIQRCLRRGDEVIVQITKEGIGTKGPTMTTYLSLPGRFLVMMPGMAQLGVSRKIEDEDARRKARQILSQLRPPRDIGFIVRTAGIDRTQREIQGDLNYLTRLWRVIERRIKTDRAPCELYQESDLIIRTIRDAYDSDVHRIVVDDEPVAKKVAEFLSIANPRGSDRVICYAGREPLFHRLGIEQEIEKLHSRHVPLPCGGSLVIDSAEALVAIDVNSGKFRMQNNADESALRVNLEAADEIARQLRLRDLGGVIICDFIDMRQERHRRMVENRLTDALKDHKERAKILRMSRFGIIEMTRQRQRPSFSRSVYQDCPHCHGRGLVKTVESMTLDVMRVIQYATHQENVHLIDARVSPSVAAHVQNRKRHILSRLESETGKTINITAVENYGADQVSYTCLDRRGRDIPLSIFANGISPAVTPGSGTGMPPKVMAFPSAAPARPMLPAPSGRNERSRDPIARPPLPPRTAAASPARPDRGDSTDRPQMPAPRSVPASGRAPVQSERPAFGQPRGARAPATGARGDDRTRPVEPGATTPAREMPARDLPAARTEPRAAPPARQDNRPAARRPESDANAAPPEAARPDSAPQRPSGNAMPSGAPKFPPPPPPPARPAAAAEKSRPAAPRAEATPPPPPVAPRPAARGDGLDQIRFGQRAKPFAGSLNPPAAAATPPPQETPAKPAPAPAKSAATTAGAGTPSAPTRAPAPKPAPAATRTRSFASSLFGEDLAPESGHRGKAKPSKGPATTPNAAEPAALDGDDSAKKPARKGRATTAGKKKTGAAKKEPGEAPARRTAKARKTESPS